MPSEAVKIDKTIDRAQHVIGRNMIVYPELVDQTLLHHQPVAQHRRRLRLTDGASESAAISRNNYGVFQRYPPEADVRLKLAC
jgi:hypothetical protein